jgi:hypothetical protein
MVPGSSAVEQAVVSRQVDGSSPFPGSQKQSLLIDKNEFTRRTRLIILVIAAGFTLVWWGALLWLLMFLSF